MLSVVLRIMPILVAVFVVLYVERVKRMGDLDHNFPSSEETNRQQRYIFDSVENKLEHMLDNKQIEEWVAQEILQTLINELVEYGWDEADGALFHYQDIPFVAQAFANCGVKVVTE